MKLSLCSNQSANRQPLITDACCPPPFADRALFITFKVLPPSFFLHYYSAQLLRLLFFSIFPIDFRLPFFFIMCIKYIFLFHLTRTHVNYLCIDRGPVLYRTSAVHHFISYILYLTI